ncbi:MAG: alpha/beta hydrolase [Bacteroidota bacterium]
MQHLLLLHGAIGASAQLASVAAQLSDKYTIHTLDFSGHGGKPADAAFTMELFANDVLEYMAAQQLESVSVFGYSMGGYVGMYLAKHHPEKVAKLVTLATKYHWDEATAAKETQMLNPDKIAQKLPAFADILQQRHAPADWKTVLGKTAEMMLALGSSNPLQTADYTTITTPSLILLGDRDKMVTLDETLVVYKALPNAQLGILPHTPHPIEQVDVDLLGFMVRKFCG